MRPPPPAAIHPTFPPSMSCSPSCQPVWPPTRTTFSSFPPLTSPPYSSTTLSTFPSPPPPLSLLSATIATTVVAAAAFAPPASPTTTISTFQHFSFSSVNFFFPPPLSVLLNLSTISGLPADDKRCTRARLAFYSLSLSRYRYHFSSTRTPLARSPEPHRSLHRRLAATSHQLTCERPRYIETVSDMYRNLPSAATAIAKPSRD